MMLCSMIGGPLPGLWHEGPLRGLMQTREQRGRETTNPREYLGERKVTEDDVADLLDPYPGWPPGARCGCGAGGSAAARRLQWHGAGADRPRTGIRRRPIPPARRGGAGRSPARRPWAAGGGAL